jgi:hypothetical protein
MENHGIPVDLLFGRRPSGFFLDQICLRQLGKHDMIGSQNVTDL